MNALRASAEALESTALSDSGVPHRSATARPARRHAALGIRWIVTAFAVLLAAGPVLMVGTVAERSSRAALAQEIETRLLLSARNLANTSSRALLGDYPELTLQPLIRTMLSEQPELAWAVVLDHRGIVQGHPDARQLGRTFEPPSGLTAIPRARALDRGESLLGSRRLLVARSVVRGPDGNDIGTALVALDRGYAAAALARSRREQALALAVLVLLAVATAFVSMSLLLRPVDALRAGLERIGRGDFDSPIRVRDRTELGLLADSINDVARDLKRGQVEMIERERLAHEIDLAREIQRSLLPAAPYEGGSLIVRGEQLPANEVGGDSYDILPLADGRVAVVIADVAGKGLAGCLVMAMCSVLLRSLRHLHPSPSALLAALDQSLGESLKPGVFVTLFYGVADPASGRITWASAGHNPALHFRRATGAVERCASRGVPLGATRGGVIRHTLADQTLELAPGDLLIQYTDAFTEAFAPDTREPFGLDRLEASVARHAPSGADALIDGLRADVRRWTGRETPEDDETLLVVARPLADVAASHPEEDPSRWLAVARDRGMRLELEADLDTLREQILRWLPGVGWIAELAPQELDLLGTALYEVCANIAEHGYGGEPSRRFELWWAPGAPHQERTGCFVVRDEGQAFQPRERPWTNFRDQEVWRRGRGFGLEIIHRVMRDVVYQPGTGDGNVTLLRFGPRRDATGSDGAQ